MTFIQAFQTVTQLSFHTRMACWKLAANIWEATSCWTLIPGSQRSKGQKGHWKSQGHCPSELQCPPRSLPRWCSAVSLYLQRWGPHCPQEDRFIKTVRTLRTGCRFYLTCTGRAQPRVRFQERPSRSLHPALY